MEGSGTLLSGGADCGAESPWSGGREMPKPRKSALLVGFDDKENKLTAEAATAPAKTKLFTAASPGQESDVTCFCTPRGSLSPPSPEELRLAFRPSRRFPSLSPNPASLQRAERPLPPLDLGTSLNSPQKLVSPQVLAAERCFSGLSEAQMHLTEATTAVDSPKVAEQERQDLVHRLAEVTEQLKAAEAHKQGLELQLCDSISELDLMKCSNEEMATRLLEERERRQELRRSFQAMRNLLPGTGCGAHGSKDPALCRVSLEDKFSAIRATMSTDASPILAPGDTCIGGGVPKASESAISCGFEALLDDQIEFSQKENSWEQGRIWEVLDAAEQVESCPELHGEGIEEKIDIVLLGLWQQKADVDSLGSTVQALLAELQMKRQQVADSLDILPAMASALPPRHGSCQASWMESRGNGIRFPGLATTLEPKGKVGCAADIERGDVLKSLEVVVEDGRHETLGAGAYTWGTKEQNRPGDLQRQLRSAQAELNAAREMAARHKDQISEMTEKIATLEEANRRLEESLNKAMLRPNIQEETCDMACTPEPRLVNQVHGLEAALASAESHITAIESVVARGLAGAPGMPAEAMLHLPVSRTKDSLASWLRDMEAVLEKVVQRLQQRERRVVQLKAQLRAEKARNKAGESAVKEARQRLLALQDAGVPSSARCGSPGTLERHQGEINQLRHEIAIKDAERAAALLRAAWAERRLASSGNVDNHNQHNGSLSSQVHSEEASLLYLARATESHAGAPVEMQMDDICGHSMEISFPLSTSECLDNSEGLEGTSSTRLPGESSQPHIVESTLQSTSTNVSIYSKQCLEVECPRVSSPSASHQATLGRMTTTSTNSYAFIWDCFLAAWNENRWDDSTFPTNVAHLIAGRIKSTLALAGGAVSSMLVLAWAIALLRNNSQRLRFQ